MSKLTVTYNNTNIINELGGFTSPVPIKYYDNSGTLQTIATVADGQTKTLQCNNQFMRSNVGIGNKTLQCAGKLMNSNILVSLVSERIVPPTPTAGSTPVLMSGNLSYYPASDAWQRTWESITIPIAGTYTFKWSVHVWAATSGTKSALYQNGVQVGSVFQTSANSKTDCSQNLTCAVGDVIELYCTSHSGTTSATRGTAIGLLVACINWDFSSLLPSSITTGDVPVYCTSSGGKCRNQTSAHSLVSMTIPKAGTYNFKWSASGGNWTQLYKNGSAVGNRYTFSATGGDGVSQPKNCTETITCNAGDTIAVYLEPYLISVFGQVLAYYGGCSHLTACIDWDNGFVS